MSQDFTQTESTVSNSAATVPAEASCSSLERHMQDAEQLVTDLKRILVRYEDALDEEGIREEIETLERWAQSYRLGMRAAAKLSEQGTELLSHARERLKLAADEISRMEAEGTPAPDEEGSKLKAEDYLKASRRIDKMMPVVEQMTSPEPIVTEQDNNGPVTTTVRQTENA